MRFIRTYVAAFLLLTACADQPPIFRPVTVDMPIAVKCGAHPVAVPDFALAHVMATTPLFDKVKACLVEIDQRKAYEALLVSQNQSCLN